MKTKTAIWEGGILSKNFKLLTSSSHSITLTYFSSSRFLQQ